VALPELPAGRRFVAYFVALRITVAALANGSEIAAWLPRLRRHRWIDRLTSAR
jgi:hypothetical protein